MAGEEPLVSVVVPLWNEEDLVGTLVERLRGLAASGGVSWEFVFVNDGSTDGTEARLRACLSSLPRWTLIRLSRNFGQQAAYRAGLDHAGGDAVVFLDADLQDPPERIPELVAKWREGAKVVVGCRLGRAERGVRRLLLDGFHRVFHRLTGGVMPADSGTFGLMDRLVADQLRAMPEVNLFLPALRCWVGFSQATISYERQERAAGPPKQSLRRLFNYAWDGITSFSEVPLRLITGLGLLIFIIGAAYSLFLVAVKVVQLWGFLPQLRVPGFTTIAVAVLSIGGIQLMCLGIVGEYLARIFRESKHRPVYIVAETTRSGPGP